MGFAKQGPVALLVVCSHQPTLLNADSLHGFVGTQEEAVLWLFPHLIRLCIQTYLKLARFNLTGDKNNQRQETPAPRLELGLPSSSPKERPQASSLETQDLQGTRWIPQPSAPSPQPHPVGSISTQGDKMSRWTSPSSA